ncbi:MAG: N4-gp56 family major capsid protein [Cohaesibacter sp.]|jgi:N4-gp56 family major capsid protein|nr:N4-gp56 family major capsid protein [Cohaesibacter sp.]
MSATKFGTNDALTQKAWAKKLATEAQAETYVGKFIGSSDTSLIQKKNDLKKDAGDKIIFGLRAPLQGEGVGEGETLEGNEEKLQTYDDNVEVNELHHAVRVKPKGSIDDQRVSFNARSEGKDGLKEWFSERYDRTFFNQICGNTAQKNLKFTGNNIVLPPSRIIRPGNRANDEDLVADDIFNLHMVRRAVNMAKTGRNGRRRMRPLKIRGKKMWVMFIHEDQAFQLREDVGEKGWNDIQMAAMKAGDVDGNPIFTDALGVHNNVIFHATEHVTLGVSADGTDNVDSTRRAALCGAQAAIMAGGKGYSELGHKWVERDFDYGREVGVSAQSLFGMKKARFNDQDNGVVVVATHAPDPNG